MKVSVLLFVCLVAGIQARSLGQRYAQDLAYKQDIAQYQQAIGLDIGTIHVYESEIIKKFTTIIRFIRLIFKSFFNIVTHLTIYKALIKCSIAGFFF